jgi:hypothetical protein
MSASLAANEARIGKPLKAVLAARTRINKVATCTNTNSARPTPSPSTCWAIWATRVGCPESNGLAWSRIARKVMPMNRNPMIRAIAVRVRWAFCASGLRKAGTPSAIASTPVRAVVPAA